MTRRIVPFFLVVLAAGLFVRPAAAEHPELSGMWRLDPEASRFGATPPVVSGVLVITTGSHKMIDISVTTKDSRLERTVEDHWRIDDHYHPVTGDSSGEVLAKWEGPVLLGRRQTDGGVQEIRFRLSPGGESLTESIQSGSGITTLIWRRQ